MFNGSPVVGRFPRAEAGGSQNRRPHEWGSPRTGFPHPRVPTSLRSRHRGCCVAFRGQAGPLSLVLLLPPPTHPALGITLNPDLQSTWPLCPPRQWPGFPSTPGLGWSREAQGLHLSWDAPEESWGLPPLVLYSREEGEPPQNPATLLRLHVAGTLWPSWHLDAPLPCLSTRSVAPLLLHRVGPFLSAKG